MEEPIEQVEAMPLLRKRRFLGYLIPGVNAPIFVLNLYVLMVTISSGAFFLNSFDTIATLMVVASAVLVGVLVPWWIPVYRSSYSLEPEGFATKRFLRRDLIVPYKAIERIELYIREPGEISEEGEKYAKDSAETLRKAGLKFVDYTNSDANIALILTGNRVLMVSPSRPRAFLKSLKRRAPRLKAKIVELGPKGKTIQEIK